MTGLEEARTFLPWWVVWGPLVVRLPLLFVLSFMIAWLASTISSWPLRRATDLPWYERARLAYPFRGTAKGTILLLTFLPTYLLTVFDGQLCPCPKGLLTILTGLTGYSGSAIAFYFGERRVRQRSYPLSAWVRGIVFNWLIMFPALLVALVIVPLMPRTFNSTALCLIGIAAVLSFFFVLGGGILIARLLGLARTAPNRLCELVNVISRAMGIRVRAVYVISAPVANAIALPFSECIAFTSKSLEILNDEEVSTICAHELAHLSESRRVKLARLTGLLPLLSIIAIFPLANSFGPMIVLGLLLGLLLAGRGFHRLSQQLERRADSLAVKQQQNSGVYARALEKIYEANLTPVVEPGKGQLHPHLYDRLVAAGSPPEYIRPKRPAQWRFHLCGILSLFLIIILFLVVPPVVRMMAGSTDELSNLIMMAESNGQDSDLSQRGYRVWSKNQFGEAAAFLRAASETNLTSVDLPINAAVLLAYLDRCEEAEHMVREAERRLAAGGHGTLQQIDIAREALAQCRQRERFHRRHMIDK